MWTKYRNALNFGPLQVPHVGRSLSHYSGEELVAIANLMVQANLWRRGSGRFDQA